MNSRSCSLQRGRQAGQGLAGHAKRVGAVRRHGLVRAAGTVNANLQDMRRRVDATLAALEAVTANLHHTKERIREHQTITVSAPQSPLRYGHRMYRCFLCVTPTTASRNNPSQQLDL